MPSLSPTMTEGGIVEWHKKEGDKISTGDLVCDIQTDKAVVGLEAEEDGILAKILKPKDSQNIQIGDPIGLLADLDEDWKSVTLPSGVSEVKKATSNASVEIKKATALTDKENNNKAGDKLGPAVRRLLDTYGLASDSITHSGPHNILTKSDVLQFIDKSHSKPSIPSSQSQSSPTMKTSTSNIEKTLSYVDTPLTNMRLTIAKRMTTSKSLVPHFYTTGEARLDSLIKLRKQMKARGEIISVNDFVIKACSIALRLVPDVNNALNTDDSIKVNTSVDISVAVASESGLITPIIFGSDRLSLIGISNTVKGLVEKARNNKLQPQEFMGGTFTISNLGMFGIKEFTAIINSPQAAILAVGAGIPELAFDHHNPSHPKFETKMRFTLCADARIVDSNSASQFVNRLKMYLESPNFLLGETSDSNAEAWSY